MRIVWQNRLCILLLLFTIGSITIGLQSWVGDVTIYANHVEQKREELHNAILTNKAPRGGSWEAAGATGVNLRVGTIYLVEGTHKVTGLPVLKIYTLLDTVFLFIALVGLFLYLRKWLPDTYCLIGVLYFCSALPLSYFFHYFHPWDRIQLATWILLLYLLRERRPVFLGACLAVSMIVKSDTMVLPGLYFLVHVSRERWHRVAAETLGLFAVVLSVYLGLQWLFPAPTETGSLFSRGPLQILQYNIDTFLSLNVRYPALLVHGVPSLLAVVGIWSRERFVWTSVLFAFGLLAIFAAFSRFEEVRAYLMVLVLLMPAALLSLRDLLERRNRQPQIDPAVPPQAQP